MQNENLEKISKFKGDFRWLSNFYPADVYLDGVMYPTVEHAYVAAKTTELQKREEIRNLDTPGKAKRYGRNLKLRSDWDAIKLSVMEDLLRQKFRSGTMKELLLTTGDAILEEGNTWGDTFWGVCNGVGENHLGKLLMEIRKDLQ